MVKSFKNHLSQDRIETVEFPRENETETRFSVGTKLTAFEMGLTFLHLHSTYCLSVPPSASLASLLNSPRFAFNAIFTSSISCRRRCHRRRDRSDLYDIRATSNQMIHHVCKVIGKHAVDILDLCSLRITHLDGETCVSETIFTKR